MNTDTIDKNHPRFFGIFSHLPKMWDNTFVASFPGPKTPEQERDEALEQVQRLTKEVESMKQWGEGMRDELRDIYSAVDLSAWDHDKRVVIERLEACMALAQAVKALTPERHAEEDY